MNGVTLFMVRHGEIPSNKEDVYAGWSDEELTRDGETSAGALGREAAHWNIEAIYTSPIRRAVQTAEIINAHAGAELIVEEGFKEIRMGPWEGLRIDAVAERFPDDFKLWMTRPGDLAVEGRETLSELQSRAVKAVEGILGGRRGVVLAVTHVAVIRCLQLYFDGEPLNSYKSIDVPNVAVFKISRNEASGLYEMKRGAGLS